MWIWPALLLLIPLAGALVVVLAPARQAKWIALVASTATFVVSVILAGAFEHWRDGGFGLAASVPGLGLETVGITITFGADSVSMLLTLLTTLLHRRGHGRRVHRPRPDPLLHLLRVHARAHVLPHRHLGQ
ncbi:MAG: hypothetical protein ACYS1B_12425 [Planctomycetota bacterium]|jgi:NADH:ubiquinone oxidoreductase subunit 4 (subunit M)